ncbi:MAG: hypothetical protein OEV81_14965 [Betaproteobacteria bacterium]|nr:hypothetical protein [Betaproteobacteria bacterium]MDH5221568.1 hypothetical protein [Betaproteobacteria bacterium]MDH5350082.1 hypothetical protein [Betaproteobacteria bacterium]
MKRTLERFPATAIALAIVTSFGAALTFVPSGAQADDKPKDCKMNPDDPRCKDDKKY